MSDSKGGASFRRRILRWNVFVDDRPHRIGSGRVVLVACRSEPDVVEVWTDETLPEGWPATDCESHRAVQVFGTGHQIPPEAGHVLGSAIAHGGALVWHVVEMENGGRQ